MGEDSLPVFFERMLFLKQAPLNTHPFPHRVSGITQENVAWRPMSPSSKFRIVSPGSIDSRPTPRSVLEALHLLGLRPVDAGNAE